MTTPEAKEKARKKAWKQSHPDAVKASAKRYRVKHAIELRIKRDAHKDEKRAYNKSYHAAHREKIRQRYKGYWAANRTRFAPQNKAWRLRNAAKVKLNNRVWRERNRDKRTVADAKRRALKHAASVNLKGIRAFVASVKAKRTAVCYYCEALVPTYGIHFDHIVALSKGGSHSADNLCVACGSCNASKKDKPMSAWMKTRVGQQLLDL